MSQVSCNSPSQCDVLLISPPSRIFNHYRPPLALMYLSGYLKKNGVRASVADVVLYDQVHGPDYQVKAVKYREEALRMILAMVSSTKCRIAGITCYTPELDEVLNLAKDIRRVSPEVSIVVGGVHPTLYPEELFEEGACVDFAVVGEGEITLLELTRAILSGVNDFAGIEGLAYRDSSCSGGVAVTGRRAIGADLDEIASPDYADLDMDYYTSANPYAVRGMFLRSFYISSSRGCPSSCTFCVARKLRQYHGAAGYARVRSPESLIREISCLRKMYSIDSFYFIDDLFTLKKDNVIRFCTMLRESGMRLIWGCSSKVNTVDEEILSAMRSAGCMQIDFGVEKGSDGALKAVKKGITVEQIEGAFSICSRLGIRTFANLLVNTPGETEADLDDIESLLKRIKPTVVSCNIFTPFPGCEVFEESARGIGRQDYADLMLGSVALIAKNRAKYRFSSHDVDLETWSNRIMRHYNRIAPNIRSFFDSRYVACIASSSRKGDYIRQTAGLLKEFINQKYIIYTGSGKKGAGGKC